MERRVGGERFVRGLGELVCEVSCGLVDDVPDLTFELGVKSSAAESALVLVVLCMLC